MSVQIPGIDVSKHNGAINFTKVAAAGKKYVFVRLGWAGYDGRIMVHGGLDSLFHTNMKSALAAGLDVGVYVYSYCKTATAARIAAEEVLELVQPYQLAYPVAFDIEDSQYFSMGRSANTAIAQAFLTRIEKAKYYGMLYTYKSFVDSYLDMGALKGFDVWIAQYAATCTYSGSYGIWQHHGDRQKNHPAGSCPGVNGACDLNTAYRDYPDIICKAGLNNLSQQEQPTEPDPANALAEIYRQQLQVLQRQYSTLEGDCLELSAAHDKAVEENAQIRQKIAELHRMWPA